MSEFMTSDLQLASWLRLIGHELVRIDGPAKRRVLVFGDVPEADLTSYYRRTQPVNASKLFSAYRELKARLFESA